jgi:hypothetical protein
MSFKVSFLSTTGHDEDEGSNEPTIFEFKTEAERAAFMKGVDVTGEVMNGWVDATVYVKKVK